MKCEGINLTLLADEFMWSLIRADFLMTQAEPYCFAWIFTLVLWYSFPQRSLVVPLFTKLIWPMKNLTSLIYLSIWSLQYMRYCNSFLKGNCGIKKYLPVNILMSLEIFIWKYTKLPVVMDWMSVSHSPLIYMLKP